MKEENINLYLQLLQVDINQIMFSDNLNDIVERFYFATLRLKNIFKYRVNQVLEAKNNED